MPLTEYARKRNFRRTAEPGPVREKSTASRYVIQKHAATRLHYDFRLEMDGVLKSWALPKGIPFAKGERHLAVQVEDHPVAYGGFEGIIPKGQYGGGTVMLWDKGTYSTDAKPPSQALHSGKLHFTLTGKKLHGAWHMVRLRGGNQWLIIKGGDDMKPVSARLDDTSALSGKTMKQLGESSAVWESNRMARPSRIPFLRPHRNPLKTGFTSASRPGRKHHDPHFKFIEPMKARMVDRPPAHGDWIYEIKFDGFRAIAFKYGRDVRLLSRNEKDFGDKFPEIVEAVAELDVEDAVMDGEIVALDGKGVSSFQLLQAFELGEERPPIFFYVFDLLRLNGIDLRRQPLAERKAQLQQLVERRDSGRHGKKRARQSGSFIRFSASLGSDATPLLRQAEELGLEGLIGKRRESVYESGKRSGAWIKLKLHREQELVIGGYTNPEGSRKHFGALLVGFYESRKLKYCGKVGTGFNGKLLASLHSQFQKLLREDCPFVNLPELRRSRYSPRITASEMRKCHWLEPRMVCQIKFSEWTRDEKLRQPVFLGLRDDKPAKEVVRETP